MESELQLLPDVPETEPQGRVLTDDDRRDLERIAAFIGGDDSAFLELYARYEAPLLHYCRKMCHDSRVAEDSFQEAWTRIFELRVKKGYVGHFQALLFRIARNICLNAIRHEFVRNRGTVEVSTMEDEIPSEPPSGDDELRTLISNALAKLPVDQREVFVLHEYCSFTYIEIATILGKTLTNVKTTSFRARMRLRKVVASWLGLGEEDDPMSQYPFVKDTH
jgi:RNA polymerase sigma-70 factor (ECF subfamily)